MKCSNQVHGDKDGDSGENNPPSGGGAQIDLAGEWGFKPGVFDPADNTAFPETVRLPGSLAENGIGNVPANTGTVCFSPTHIYNGPGVFRHELQIPDAWAEKVITLTIERARPTKVWVDGVFQGSADSLCTPHGFDLTKSLSPGRHSLMIEADNTAEPMQFPGVRQSHMMTKHTQTNWHGLLGRIRLTARDTVFVENLRIDPDIASRTAEIVVMVRNAAKTACTGSITLHAASTNTIPAARHEAPGVTECFEFMEGEVSKTVRILLSLGERALLWDEFQPCVYELTAALVADGGAGRLCDRAKAVFGLRQVSRDGNRLRVNGRPLFLRGTNENAVFPRTAYAPMDVESWMEWLGTVREYGLNHVRFHSWCPPEAAFTAADWLGLYLQPELPYWGEVDERMWPFYRDEARRILKAYGNHPSFVMFSGGNELNGDTTHMDVLVEICRREDGRHLYAWGSNCFFSQALPPGCSDYWTTMNTDRGDVRGSFAGDRGHVNQCAPGTRQDYSAALEDVTYPVISHEIGQYGVHSDFSEIPNYTGVLSPVNLEKMRDDLERNGLLSLAKAFRQASGRLSAICYREEIETALRTPGMAGFQLLDLKDFPGQGTALVGMLDSLGESKGLITPAAWRAFCAPTVPLLKMDKYIWTSGEVFEAEVVVAHHGAAPLVGAIIDVRLIDVDDRPPQAAALGPQRAPVGALVPFGNVSFPLGRVKATAELVVELRLRGTPHVNRYSLWCFPDAPAPQAPVGVMVVRSLDESVRRHLENGGSALLFPEQQELTNSIAPQFIPDFWCYRLFKGRLPGTMGILCDPQHPALRGFPTEMHSDWQWWHLVKNGRPVVLDAAPRDLGVIVQTIDNPFRHHRLALLFEARVGRGKLLVCSIDLPALVKADRPEARRLMASLFAYAASPPFNPDCSLEWQTLNELLYGPMAFDPVPDNPFADIFG